MKQKTIKKNQELVKYRADTNRKTYQGARKRDGIVSVLDNNGISFQLTDAKYNTKSKYFDENIRLSKDGSKPYVCYPDTDFLKDPKVVKVVKKYNTYSKSFQNARKALSREANRLSNEAVKVYENEINRIKLTTEKNLLVAKIDSLRLTNKAMMIEKDYNENLNEIARHKQVIKDIEKLKILLLENNDINLKEKLAEINLNRELELDNAKSNKEKISEKIAEQIEINKVKNEFMRERIKILSSGENAFNLSKEEKEEINRVKQLKKFREKDDEELRILYSTLMKIDIDKIANREDRELAKRVIEKFESDKKIKNLYNNYMKENENKNMNSGKVNTIRSRIFGIINRKYSAKIDNELQKKIIVSAKKDVPFVSISVDKMLATQQRTLHAFFDEETTPMKKVKKTSKTKNNQLVVSKKKNDKKQKSISKNDDYYVKYFDSENYTSFDLNDEFFAQKNVKDAIRKWKKIEHRVESADDFIVDNYEDDSYKIKYLETEKNYKQERENFLDFLMEKQNERKENKASSKLNKENQREKKLQRQPKITLDKTNYYSEIKLMALKRRLERLPSDPIVFNSKNSYEYRNLMDVIAEFSQISLRKLPKTPENDAFIIEVKQIIDFYDLLVKEDKIARNNINKSMSLDAKFRSQIVKQDASIIAKQTINESKYQKQISKIEQKTNADIQKTERNHGRKIQQINKDIEWQLNNEENLHEKNKAFIKKTSLDLQKRSFLFENHQIDSLVHEINKFNTKQKEAKNIISLNDMPTKIECFEPLISGKLDLVEQEDGVYAVNRVYSKVGNKEYSAKTLNTKIPSNVSKVVVLDKFRRISNPLVRASALKELAEVNYANAVEYNLSREKSEITKANNKLEKVKIYSDSLVDDAYELDQYLELIKSKSEYSNFVQRAYDKKSKMKWKITEDNLKRQHSIEMEELRRLENKNKKLELAQRRIDNRREKYLTSLENEVLFEQIRDNNQMRSFKSRNYINDNSLVPYKDASNNNKVSLTKKILSIFRFKKDDDIDEIIGKK